MLAQLLSGTVLGIDAILVTVEVDSARGLPCMTVVGLAESAVREGRERVGAALTNSGFELRPRRVTVSLAPADVRKDGSAFDLPIALGVLAASGLVSGARLAGHCFVGELGLDGELRPVRGVLTLAEQCARDGVPTLVVPAANAAEAAATGCVDVRAARSLADVVAHVRGARVLPRAAPAAESLPEAFGAGSLDLADVRGQAHARRALEVAAAGQHGLLLVGPPGAGKSMLARRLPGILPALSTAEAIEVTKIHSVAGRLRPGQALVRMRPLRAPHHTISDAGLIGGGGALPRPGEVSLAHHGVLFLDELPEYRRHVLDALRQPLEDGEVHIGRARFGVRLPARFMLVAAMNPCPCGYHGAGNARCICNPGQITRYLGRVSGPLLDRIDIHLEVGAVDAKEIIGGGTGESSAAVRERVAEARRRQLERFGAAPAPGHAPGALLRGPDGEAIFANAQMPASLVRRFCEPDAAGLRLLRTAAKRFGLSARALHRVLRVARTIADLEGTSEVGTKHVAEAVQYRALDRVRAPYAAAKARR
jgi:magnesium chelatase family protein